MRSFLLGLAAGVAGTAAMTGWQELLPRLEGHDGREDGQPSKDEERWRQAPAPARAARNVLRAAGYDAPPFLIPLLTNAMHWAYGTGWGLGYALLRRRVRANPVAAGLVFGAGVWAASYVQLVPLGVYEPPWRYPASTVAEDLSYHAVYGVGVAGAFELLSTSTPTRPS